MMQEEEDRRKENEEAGGAVAFRLADESDDGEDEDEGRGKRGKGKKGAKQKGQGKGRRWSKGGEPEVQKYASFLGQAYTHHAAGLRLTRFCVVWVLCRQTRRPMPLSTTVLSATRRSR